MNLYKRAAEIFRKNGVPIANYTDDEEETMKNNEGVEYRVVHMYDGVEMVHSLTQEE